MRFGGVGSRYGDVLVSLPQEDRIREASSSLCIYAVDLVDVHAQNRFYNHDVDCLHHQFGFANKVIFPSTLIDDPKLTDAASLVSPLSSA